MEIKSHQHHSRFFTGVTVEQCKDAGMALELICLLAYVWLADRRILAAAVILLLINMILPVFFRPFAVPWFGCSRILGLVMSRALLILIFFTVVTPMALIRRWMGFDSLCLKKWKQSRESVFEVRNHAYTADDMEHPF